LIVYLDTNVITWLSQNKMNRISSQAQRVMRTADLLMSPMVLLELQYLYEIGRTKLPARDVQLKLAHETAVRMCDLSFPKVVDIAVHESWTRDLFDRMIVANAKANGLAYLISADEQIAKHYPRTVW
jgi:PIN domain nuclease of toxin-antitoxin system